MKKHRSIRRYDGVFYIFLQKCIQRHRNPEAACVLVAGENLKRRNLEAVFWRWGKKGSVKLVEIVINVEPHGAVSKPGQGIERRIGFRSCGLTGCGGHTDIVPCDLRATNVWSHGATKTNSHWVLSDGLFCHRIESRGVNHCPFSVLWSGETDNLKLEAGPVLGVSAVPS